VQGSDSCSDASALGKVWPSEFLTKCHGCRQKTATKP
jgi:hypothetical protein